MTIFEMSLGGGVLIAAILILRRVLLYRVPKWAFLLLWAVALCRLLLPFSVPSPFSVYTGAARLSQSLEQEATVPSAEARAPAEIPVPPGAPDLEPGPRPGPSALPEKAASPLAAICLCGAALCGLFFTAAYLRNLHRFQDAAPAEGDFILRWREEHSTWLPVQVRVSGEVNAPLAYGLIRPVILLPQNTDWTDEGQLTYILTHEYVHIHRGDLFWKLLLTAALCLHWFNPLVWAMYFCANRDLELACDEAVVRILGLDSRKGYAHALLSAAESGFFPLCTTYTTKDHMEERIRAIMRIKKKSLAAALTAVLLVAGVTAVFATSKAPEAEDISSLPQAVMTNTTPEPALADKSTPGGRVHPVTPADISTSADRVHPVTGQPGDSSADTSREPAPEKTASEPVKSSGHPVNSKGQTYGYSGIVSPDTNTPDLIEVPHIVDGKNVLGGVRCYVLKEDIMPYRYPGEINNPDDAMDYMAWMGGLPYSVALPAYDQEGNSLGITEVLLNYDRPDAAQITGMDLEAAREEVKNNRWGVPVDPIPEMTEIRVATEEEEDELRQYLTQVRGIREGDMVGGRYGNGDYGVIITYELTKQEKRLANGYPVNSKGETYGCGHDYDIMGYHPDLTAVMATNGKSGYLTKADKDMFNAVEWVRAQGENPDSYDEWIAGFDRYTEWAKTQPYVVPAPVYDVDHNNIVGYFNIYNGESDAYNPSQEDIELELKTVEAALRRHMDLSEEEIARELEALKAAKGWS